MKISLRCFPVLLLAAGMAISSPAEDVATNARPSASTATTAPEVLTVAILDFEATDDAVHGLGPKVAELVNANLSAEPSIIMVERAKINEILGEHELGLSGTVSTETAAKVGQLTGAKVLVTGRIFLAGDEMIVVAKTIGTETGRVYGEMVKGKAAASIADLSTALAAKIASDVSQKGGTLVAKVESHADRVAKIKKQLDGKKLPVVSVNITEQHFGQHVIDPAAQTELLLILQECGFPVVDEHSTNQAEVEITGEALSEFGLRRGNLQSCRARIEVKARTAGSGNLLAVDRQTSVAVDIAEHIAAKTALQNGADDLAERVLPKLAP